MSSELWQRLRAARKFSDKRQQDIADVTGVSRGAVAQWESEDPNNRTRPDVDQIQKIARETSVPVEWLLNDAVDTEDVWKVGRFGVPRSTPAARAGPDQSAAAPRALETFIKAVEFAVMESEPDLLDCFDVELGTGPIPFSSHFCSGRNLVQFSTPADCCPTTIGHLLLLERAAGRHMQKHILLWHRRGEDLPDRFDEKVAYALSTFGVKVVPVTGPVKAAEYLLEQAR